MTQRTTRRTWPVVLAVVVVIVAAAGGVIWYVVTHRVDPHSPAGVALPPPSSVAETNRWLTGDGAVIVAFADAARDLVAQPPGTPQACTAWVTSRLDPLGTPTKVLAAIGGTPDQTTGEIALDEYSTVTRWLAGCVQQTPGPTSADLQRARTLMDRRLHELGQR